jgi:hypothetical protein
MNYKIWQAASYRGYLALDSQNSKRKNVRTVGFTYLFLGTLSTSSTTNSRANSTCASWSGLIRDAGVGAGLLPPPPLCAKKPSHDQCSPQTSSSYRYIGPRSSQKWSAWLRVTFARSKTLGCIRHLWYNGTRASVALFFCSTTPCYRVLIDAGVCKMF